MDVGSRIKMIRDEKNLSQQKLADLISKSKSTIEKYESGVIDVSYTTLEDISQALNVSIIRLVADDFALLNNIKDYYDLKDKPNYNMEDDFKMIMDGFIKRYK